MTAFDEYMEKIRNVINEPRMLETLYRDRESWQLLYSSLDVIEDSQLAIEAFVAGAEHDGQAEERGAEDWGARYLSAYGVLQALYLQQDAINHACESLDVELNVNDYPRIQEARDIRHSSAGHPTRRTHRGEGSSKTYHGIVRISLTAQGFTLHTYTEEGRVTAEFIDMQELVAGQAGEVETILAHVIETLERRAE